MESLDPLAAYARNLLTSIQANRVREFGWEHSVSNMSADRLRELAIHLPDARDILLIAAQERDNVTP